MRSNPIGDKQNSCVGNAMLRTESLTELFLDQECPAADKFQCPAQPFVIQYDTARTLYDRRQREQFHLDLTGGTMNQEISPKLTGYFQGEKLENCFLFSHTQHHQNLSYCPASG